MKFLIVSLAVLAVASADVPHQPPAAILKQAQDISPDGSYSYSYETDNGIYHGESGTLVASHAKDGTPFVVAQGQYQYTSPDGTPIAVKYVADENGFQPEGEHIHQIPPLIQKAIEYIRAHPPSTEHPHL
ncbi:larval cuticle protein LCP-17 isoform X2 [Megachile rotundata]|uniref:larval cuticle protein LCP-17 isoform X2 n=1 Tax=Megachile rotundata TaxID=143995 RepID=UPI000258DA68|nr:PREDICTED: larval cuticle protein LCP-17-like [Megachile rotundata]